jgi:hypothetical protein
MFLKLKYIFKDSLFLHLNLKIGFEKISPSSNYHEYFLYW